MTFRLSSRRHCCQIRSHRAAAEARPVREHPAFLAPALPPQVAEGKGAEFERATLPMIDQVQAKASDALPAAAVTAFTRTVAFQAGGKKSIGIQQSSYRHCRGHEIQACALARDSVFCPRLLGVALYPRKSTASRWQRQHCLIRCPWFTCGGLRRRAELCCTSYVR